MTILEISLTVLGELCVALLGFVMVCKASKEKVGFVRKK